MPTLEKTERESSFHQKLTLTIADLNLIDPKLNFNTPITDTILKGSWRFSITGVIKDDSQAIQCEFTFNDVAKSSLGTDINATFVFGWVKADGTVESISQQLYNTLPSLPDPRYTPGYTAYVFLAALQAKATASNGSLNLQTHRRYSVGLELKSVAIPECTDVAVRQSDLHSSPLPHDLRFNFFYFRTSLELWTRSNSLPLALQIALHGAVFNAPATTGRSTRNAPPPSMPVAHLSYDSDLPSSDSDAEDDAIYFRNSLGLARQVNEMPTPNTFRQVNLKGIKYSTFKALLVYLDSGHIQFSPLTSSFPLTSPPFPTRKAYLEKRLLDHPKLPLPVSPKSMYRLATLFDVSSLKTLSLSSLKSSLTLSNAAQELFSPLSISHEEVQGAIIEYVGANWKAIRDGESYKEIVKRIKRDEIKGAGKVLVDLIVAVQGN